MPQRHHPWAHRFLSANRDQPEGMIRQMHRDIESDDEPGRRPQFPKGRSSGSNPEVAAGTFGMATKRPVSSGSKARYPKTIVNRKRTKMERTATGMQSHESFVCVSGVAP